MKHIESQRSEAAADPSAIVLGGQVNGLGVIRSLGRIGVPVGLVAVPIDGDHAHHSRYVRATRCVSGRFTDNELLSTLEDLRRALKRERTVIIPTSDQFSQFLCVNQERLGDQYLFTCSTPATNDSFLDKWRTAEICRQYGMRIPRTECPENYDQLCRVAESLSYPVIVKPRYTFGSSFPGKNQTVTSVQALCEFFEQHSILDKAIIQEVVPSGDGDILVIGTYSGHDGIVRAIYSGRKIRQHLPDYGATCFGVSETYPELREQTRIFLEAIGYKGFSMVEFARSREDGQAYFLELNTRTSWTNQLYADAGIDLSQIAYRDLVNKISVEPEQYFVQIDDVAWLDFRRDWSSMRIKRKAGQITALEWLGSLFKARSFAHWDWRDPIPFMAACIWRFRKAAAKPVQVDTG